ncbi:acyl-ACP--UDP-N-acetylglucosamine O-acyltransferase [Phaeovibrio sulfidiphilus]|uniref:Acyl-[acyl-carrier-protein]--UDP-N-acetylglucosamine O-acyltransferase n=1 Tax=Phaeovibrio sulfidiphilus TaxID=1220600 RepID=A0A8J6YLR2_9PROT|nr:acyl-ACP--UDP-N-acetylglucosamine O-acyltransferase [Phaeovibrio sulfidiphilus]MBE1236913.1 acyl-ACP--UDP-N-acetylglucosamine O-acyltransferase [Phaeovibrio sulfidiphilus]
MPKIHSTALVEPGAEIASSAVIGPYCTVGAEVVIGENVELVSHVVVSGRTTIGEGTKVYPFASLGLPPQDLKYRGEPSRLEIGRRNTIREHVTMNTGTEGGQMVTRVGDDGLFMIGVHVAHDCIVGNRVIIANNVLMAGHVEVADYAVLGGGSAIHQFTRIGKLAMIGGLSAIGADVLPFTTALSGGTGRNGQIVGLNIVGLRRAGYTREDIANLRDAFRLLFSGDAIAEQKALMVERWPDSAPISDVAAFLDTISSRGLVRPGDDVEV